MMDKYHPGFFGKVRPSMPTKFLLCTVAVAVPRVVDCHTIRFATAAAVCCCSVLLLLLLLIG